MRKIKYAIVLTGTLLSFMGGANSAFAAGDGTDEISGHLGSMLPNQIEGVTEILPIFGFRYAHSVASGLSIEGGLENAHAKGVDFTAATFDLRGDIPLGDQMFALLYGGLTFNYYSKINTQDRQSEWGGNVGGALLAGITETLAVRADLRMSASPGTSLYLGFGLAFRL